MKFKKRNMAYLSTVCNLCLALGAYIQFSKISFVLFGEPRFPNAADYE